MSRTSSIVLAAGLLSCVACISTPVRAQIHAFDANVLRDANDLIKANRYNDAIAKLTPLVPQLAGNPDFDTLYGIALLEGGRPTEAAATFRRALAVQPDNLPARGSLGRALAATGELDDARREMSVVLERPDITPELKKVMEHNIAMLDEAKKKQAERAGPQFTPADIVIVKSAAELVRAGKASIALKKLEPLVDRLAGNPEFDYVYGVASLDSGRPAQAATALRRAVEVNPNFMNAHAELGRALAAMGDLAGAKRELEVVQASGEVPSTVRNVIGQQITAIDQASLAPKQLDETRGAPPAPQPARPATRVTGYFEASVGYDSNVNGGPTSDTLLIPAFSYLGPASLSPNSLPKKSAFYELGGGVSIVHAFSNDLAAFANIVGNWHMLTENQEFRSDLIGLETGVARQVAGVGIFSIAAVGQAFSIGDNTYRNAYGLAAQWRNKIDGWEPSISFTWLRLEYPHITMQDADHYTGAIGLARTFDVMFQPTISVALTLGKEITVSSIDDFLSYTFSGVRGGVEWKLTPWLTSFVQAGYEVRQYEADYPLFFYRRHDQWVDYTGGFNMKLAENLSFSPTIRYYGTQSNVDLFAAKRWIGQGTLRWTY